MPAINRITNYDYHDDCEKKVYAEWINRNLFNEESLAFHLPVNPNGEALFDGINDGLIFCEIINKIFPHSIDLNVLMVGSYTSKENKIKNLQLALETTRSFGCQIDNIRVNDIFSGVRQSILELFWQIFYIGLVVSINYENFPEIDVLRDSNEPKDIIREMKPEEILIRYVNYEIRLFNPGSKSLRSFKDNLGDGSIYALLLDSLSQQQCCTLKNPTMTIMKEKNEKFRNDMLFENFDSLKMQGFIIEELMNCLCSDIASYKMHLLTMAMFFHEFGIDQSLIQSNTVSEYERRREKVEKETNIEKLCRCFLNFICVKPVVTNLCNDCKDGLIFAQVMEMYSPDLFKKDDFIEQFNDEQLETKRIHNGAIIINRFDPFLNVPIKEFYAEYIRGGREKVICGIMFNLMIHWACNADPNARDSYSVPKKRFKEKELMAWINGITNDYKIYSFRDTLIHDKNLLAKVIDYKCPKSINWKYLKELTNRGARAKYVVSVARREGYPMFIHPSMIASCDYRCTTLAFAIMKDKIPNYSKNVCPD